MLYRVLFVLIIVLVIGLFPVIAAGADTASQTEAPVFTNQDTEKYKTPADNNPSVIKTKMDKATEKSEKAQKIKEEQEKEYWCKKTIQCKNKIEKIKEEIAEAEKELSGENSMHLSYKEKKAIQKKIKSEKKKLKYAENDLAEFEDEAHRKGIPPGWLRCQFE